MIFIDIFLLKINEIIFLIFVYYNSEDLEEEENHELTYNNSIDFLDNEYSDQENWFNGEK